MKKFNIDNVEFRFIKNLLLNTYLPNFPVACLGDFIVADVLYTFGNTVIECTESGILLGDETTYYDNVRFVHRADGSNKFAPACADSILCRTDFLCGVGVRTAKYREVSTFYPHIHTPGLTSNVVSHSTLYNEDVHKQLGKYLRWYKSLYKIDLMPLYNCFSNIDTTYLNLTTTKVESGNNPDVTTWIVPALLNKTYHIYINSSQNVLIRGVFLNDLGRIIKGYDDKDDEIYVDELLNEKVTIVPSSTYSYPIKYKTFSSDASLLNYSNNFYIAIQVPRTHNSSIAVIESDNDSSRVPLICSNEIFINRKLDKWPNIGYEFFNPPVTPSLTTISTKDIIPYADRLLEYLLNNVIDDREDIPKNIKRLQERLNISDKYGLNEDVWSSLIKQLLYNNYYKAKATYRVGKLHPLSSDVSHIPSEKLVYEKDQDGNVKFPKKVIGTKNVPITISHLGKSDILGYCDKDVENSLYNYRGE